MPDVFRKVNRAALVRAESWARTNNCLSKVIAGWNRTAAADASEERGEEGQKPEGGEEAPVDR